MNKQCLDCNSHWPIVFLSAGQFQISILWNVRAPYRLFFFFVTVIYFSNLAIVSLRSNLFHQHLFTWTYRFHMHSYLIIAWQNIILFIFILQLQLQRNSIGSSTQIHFHGGKRAKFSLSSASRKTFELLSRFFVSFSQCFLMTRRR